jgi:hypothetical protein
LCELIPGGVAKEITAGHAAQLLAAVTPAGAVETARCELAAAFLDDLRRIDAQLLDVKKKLTVAVRSSGTTLTAIFGVGPVVAATVIGAVRDVSRFPGRDHFAAYNGTAPIEVSSGHRKIYRLSRRGNRRLNHVIHMAAVTQIRYRHSDGRAYYDKKIAEGKTPKEALRALKRRVSDTVFATCKPTPGGPQRAPIKEPGRARGERLCRQRGRLTPQAPALRLSHPQPYDRQPQSGQEDPAPGTARKIHEPLDTKRHRYGAGRCRPAWLIPARRFDLWGPGVRPDPLPCSAR